MTYTTSNLSGQTVCITGGLTAYTRTEAIQLIRDMGGRVTKKVSRKTDILIVAKSSENTVNPSEKMVRAWEYGTEIWTEKRFMKAITI